MKNQPQGAYHLVFLILCHRVQVKCNFNILSGKPVCLFAIEHLHIFFSPRLTHKKIVFCLFVCFLALLGYTVFFVSLEQGEQGESESLLMLYLEFQTCHIACRLGYTVFKYV